MSQRPGSTDIPSVDTTLAPRGIVEFANPPDRRNPLPFDQDHAVPDWRPTETIDECATNKSSRV